MDIDQIVTSLESSGYTVARANYRTGSAGTSTNAGLLTLYDSDKNEVGRVFVEFGKSERMSLMTPMLSVAEIVASLTERSSK